MNAAPRALAIRLASRTRPRPGPNPFGYALNAGERTAECRNCVLRRRDGLQGLQRVTRIVTAISERNQMIMTKGYRLQQIHSHTCACARVRVRECCNPVTCNLWVLND
jgi:hypothetical protein